MHGERGACVAKGGGACVMKGVCMATRACVAKVAGLAGNTATAADGMHPTGMHSCDCIFLPISHSQSQTQPEAI